MPSTHLPKDTVVEKINSKPGDKHQDGARGKVLKAKGKGYLVEFDDEPGVPWFLVGTKLSEVAAFRSAPLAKKKRGTPK